MHKKQTSKCPIFKQLSGGTMETIISDFQKNIEKIFSGRLKSIILYGSSVTGSGPPPRDINIMVMADSIEEEDLLGYRSVAGRYQKKGISNPIFMEADFFKNSANIFPLEYTEIKQTGKVISGSDPFADLEIDMRNLGYQVEFELRGKLLRLRRRVHRRWQCGRQLVNPCEGR
jgi:hypothetical protein